MKCYFLKTNKNIKDKNEGFGIYKKTFNRFSRQEIFFALHR